MTIKRISKKTSLIIICCTLLLAVVATITGFTYAYWVRSLELSQINSITHGCFDMEITDEQNTINLTNTFPMTIDDARAKLTPFTFKVKNTCSLAANYDINLVLLEDTNMDEEQIDVLLNNSTYARVDELEGATTDISGATAKNILSGIELGAGKEHTYSLLLWMDESVTTSNGENKQLQAKVSITGTAIRTDRPKCIRATTLHTDVCEGDPEYIGIGCSDDMEIGDTIIYGNTDVTNGELNVGDAFTCDVNGDGKYNELTERFYYVSDLYVDTDNPGTSEAVNNYNNNIAVLQYYSNTIIENDLLTQNNRIDSPYNSNNINTEGPVSLMQHIPSSAHWGGISLYNMTRQLKTYDGRNLVEWSSGSEKISSPLLLYTYTDKVARLLTYQEFIFGCNGNIDTLNCLFLFENTMYGSGSSMGYWLETPFYKDSAAAIDGYTTGIYGWYVNAADYYGVRPVIEVPKDDIGY